MYCRICNNTNLIFYTKSKKWELYKCLNCGFVQVKQKPNNSDLQKIYSSSYFIGNKYQDLCTLYKEYNYRLNLMSKFIPIYGKVLDYGCAKADFIEFAYDKYNFIGIDYSADAIEEAKNKNPKFKDKLFNNDEINIITDHSLDGIVMWDVIEHLWNPSQILEILARKIKRKAFIIISTPKIDSFFAKLTKKYWPFMTPPEHLSFFSKNAFIELAKKHNLLVVDIKNKGKWVNIGFMIYKIRRIIPKLIPIFLIKLFKLKYTSKLSIYVPSNDIQYVVLKKE